MVARCRHEIAAIEALLRSGHSDMAGLCLGLADWSTELRLIERESKGTGSGSDKEKPPPDG